MLNYMLKSEDLLRGLFPKVSLETIYINLYNLSKLRDVEKVLDELEKNSRATRHCGITTRRRGYQNAAQPD